MWFQIAFIVWCRYLPGSGRSENIPAYFSRKHAPINTTTEFWARPADWPGVVWHEFPSGENALMDGAGGFGGFFHAQGGLCSGRQVDYGYWCSANAPRSGGGRLQPPYNPPGGFFYDSNGSLPQAHGYQNASGAVFHARGGTNPYFSYMCLVDSVNTSSRAVHFDAEVGCDQGGPTTKTGAAWDWFIEGVLEECDSPGEYYLDVQGRQLFYTFNTSETPSGEEQFFVTTTKVLLNITSVRGVTVRGITFRDAALTYLGTTEADKHYLPSSVSLDTRSILDCVCICAVSAIEVFVVVAQGDWALQRSGAITITDVEGVSIEHNQFSRCDGNGISLNGYARSVSLIANDFNWIGESAMTSFGDTSDCLCVSFHEHRFFMKQNASFRVVPSGDLKLIPWFCLPRFANCSVRLPGPVGPDGRGGTQPRGTRVVGNLVREFGLFQKLVSTAYFFFCAIILMTRC